MKDWNSGILTEVFHHLDFVRDLFVPQSCSLVSWFGEPNNGIRASISEVDAEAEVEGTLRETNIISGSASFFTTSNKGC
jgi:hypothetical protein